MATVRLVAVEGDDGIRDGGAGWQLFVDDKLTIDHLGSGDLDLADASLDPLWKALGITIQFDWD